MTKPKKWLSSEERKNIGVKRNILIKQIIFEDRITFALLMKLTTSIMDVFLKKVHC